MVRLKKIKKEIISKAKELGVVHEAKFKGCAQCTFLAIFDALCWGGIELITKDVQRKYFGKAWDLADDDMAHEFLTITRGCTIMETAQWTTGIILDELEKKKSGKTPKPGNK